MNESSKIFRFVHMLASIPLVFPPISVPANWSLD